MQHDLTFRVLTGKGVSVDVRLISSRMTKANSANQNSRTSFHWGTLQWPIIISGILQVFLCYND